MSSLNNDSQKEGSSDSFANEQETRAVLREKFLRCVSNITGEFCQLKTVELSDLSGFYHGMDIHVQNIFMKDLKTPFSQLKNGLLRSQDILYIKFPVIEGSLNMKSENVNVSSN